jgi:hypothetical protein
MVTRVEAAKATVRGALRRKREAYAIAAEFEPVCRQIMITFNTGGTATVPSDYIEGLFGADAAALANIQITPSGLGLHWPDLDVDINLPALMAGVFGSRKWMASEFGAAGGRARTESKIAAAQENGKKGGRPRKIA